MKASPVSWLKTRGSAILLIAATYFYFLIFAQFGFLHRVVETLGPGPHNSILATMALAGVFGALLTGFRFRYEDARAWLSGGFAGTGSAALLAAHGCDEVLFHVAAGLGGLSLASLTVALVGALRVMIPREGIGLACGAGTGLAYLMSNVPPVFEATATGQCLLALLTCAAGLGLTAFYREPKALSAKDCFLGPVNDRSRASLTGLGIIFLVLVWADSAAFTRIQADDGLRSASWSGAAHLWPIGAMHFLAAVLGGILIDRGRMVVLMVLAFLSLAVGFLLLKGPFPGLPATLLYASGVSFYSTALVAFALVRERRFTPYFQAGLVFAISGWIGSTLGIGMANDLGRVPLLFWALAAVVLLGGVVLHGKEGLA